MQTLEIINQRRLESAFEKLKRSKLSPKNKDIIRQFLNTRMHAKAGTRVKYLCQLSHAAKCIKKPLDKISRKQFNEYMPVLEKSFAPRTYNDRVKTLRMFYRWMKKPEVTQDAQKKKNIHPVHQATDLLTFEEIKRLLDACYNLRDRCLLHMLWETGARIDEMLSIQIKDIKEEEFGFTAIIRESKTIPRPAIIVDGKDDLDAWLQHHPHKDMPDAPLFMSSRYRHRIDRLQYTTIKTLLENLAEKTGIKKHLHCHLFRKSRASYLITKRKWSTPLVEKALGWSEGSRVLKEYVRLSMDDVKDRVLEDVGIRKAEEENNKTWKCLFCSHLNSATRDRCYMCKKSKKTAEELHARQIEMEDIMNVVQSMKREIAVIKARA